MTTLAYFKGILFKSFKHNNNNRIILNDEVKYIKAFGSLIKQFVKRNVNNTTLELILINAIERICLELNYLY